MPLISVVMPVFNGQRDLKEAIDSVIGQSIQRFRAHLCR